jgi:hypothetical protein
MLEKNSRPMPPSNIIYQIPFDYERFHGPAPANPNTVICLFQADIIIDEGGRTRHIASARLARGIGPYSELGPPADNFGFQIFLNSFHTPRTPNAGLFVPTKRQDTIH